jgi:hypothetical protein
MPEPFEVNVEAILGHRVRDVDGAVIGRLEELECETIDGELVVTELHVGPAAVIERLGFFFVQLPFLRLLPIRVWEYRIPWQQVDLSDAGHVRVRCAKRELTRTILSDDEA